MSTEPAEEVDRLQALLMGMSTLAVAQDGEARQRFDTLAATAAAGLGVPALILSPYGADEFLPFAPDLTRPRPPAPGAGPGRGGTARQSSVPPSARSSSSSSTGSSGTSHSTPDGGSWSTAEAGRPCQGFSSASTTPRFPTPEPP